MVHIGRNKLDNDNTHSLGTSQLYPPYVYLLLFYRVVAIRFGETYTGKHRYRLEWGREIRIRREKTEVEAVIPFTEIQLRILELYKDDGLKAPVFFGKTTVCLIRSS